MWRCGLLVCSRKKDREGTSLKEHNGTMKENLPGHIPPLAAAELSTGSDSEDSSSDEDTDAVEPEVPDPYCGRCLVLLDKSARLLHGSHRDTVDNDEQQGAQRDPGDRKAVNEISSVSSTAPEVSIAD